MVYLKLRGRAPVAIGEPAKKKPRKVKAPIPTEHEEQVEFFRRVDADPQTRDLAIYAVPNFSGRLGNVPPIAAIRQAQRLKAEGRRKGVLDINVDEPRPKSYFVWWEDPVPPPHFHGLRIEMKRKGEKPTPEQRIWMTKFEERGFKVAICYTADAAWQTLCDYLGIPTTPTEAR